MGLGEGSPVTYIGDSEHVVLGEHGRVLTDAGPTSSHVMWATGAITLEHDLDLSPGHSAPFIQHDASLDDSLEVGGLQATSMREVMDVYGPEGVLNALASAGKLGEFQAIAEEAYTLIQTRIRSMGVMQAVVGQLDEDDVESLVTLASSVLLRDAFAVAE